jgi:hypothetical protein
VPPAAPDGPLAGGSTPAPPPAVHTPEPHPPPPARQPMAAGAKNERRLGDLDDMFD